MKKYVFLFMISSFMMPSYVYAADIECKALPSCEDMGYLYTKDDCVNMPRLKCPFDLNKYYCKKSAQKDCQIGDRYMLDGREKTSGCTVNGEGGYVLLGKNDSGQCRIYPLNNGYSRAIRSNFCASTAKSRLSITNGVMLQTGLNLFDLLTFCRKGINLTEIEQVTLLNSTCAVPTDYKVCVNLANCTIDYCQGVSPAEDGRSTVYPCSYINASKIVTTNVDDCHTDAGVPNGETPTAKDLVKSTCVPGTYRREAGDSGVEFCLSKPLFSEDLIVSIPDGFLEDHSTVYYIDMSADYEANAFTHNADLYRNAENKLKLRDSGLRLPTFEELKILLKNLHDNGTISTFMSDKGLGPDYVFLSHDGDDPNNGYSCLKFDFHNPHAEISQPTILQCKNLAGTYFSVIGVNYGSFDIEGYTSDIEQ